MKILNLYAGIGGNRRSWQGQITAVEWDPKIAAVYKDLYPEDTVIIGDAHQYLLDHYNEYDFIWSSPPCQSHSRMRQFVGVKAKGFKPIYPDMSLYQEILFLQHNVSAKWTVENVNPYYTALIEPTARIGRHLFWSNLPLESYKTLPQNLRSLNKIEQVEDLHGIDLQKYDLPNKRQVLRNCVDSDIGQYVFELISS